MLLREVWKIKDQTPASGLQKGEHSWGCACMHAGVIVPDGLAIAHTAIDACTRCTLAVICSRSDELATQELAKVVDSNW